MANCAEIVVKASKGSMTEKEAERLLEDLKREAAVNARANKFTKANAIKEALAGKMVGLPYEAQTKVELTKLRALKAVQRDRRIKSRIDTFLAGKEGIYNAFVSLIEGVTTTLESGKDSMDAQRIALTRHFRTGRLYSRIEALGLKRDFAGNKHVDAIYKEMEGMDVHGKSPGETTGNKKAGQIAQIIKETNLELNQLLRAEGVPIHDLPGYVVVQTHSSAAVQRGGHGSKVRPDERAAKAAWVDFARSLIDPSKYEGRNIDDFLKGFVDSVYSGVYGSPKEQLESLGATGFSRGSLSAKLASERLLHFKDAESAAAYSKRYGNSDLATSIDDQIRAKASALAQIRFFGDDPEGALTGAIDEWLKWARNQEGMQGEIDHLRNNQGALMRKLRTSTGAAAYPENASLARFDATVRSVVRMATLGGSFFTSLADPVSAFAEMRWWGVKGMTAFGDHIEALMMSMKGDVRRAVAEHTGAAAELIGGHVTARYEHDAGTVPNGLRWAERLYYQGNLQSWQTDVMQSTAGLMMGWNLARQAGKGFSELGPRFQNLLKQYGITALDWDGIRTGVEKVNDREVIFADTIKQPTDDYLEARGLGPTAANRKRVHVDLQTKLQTLLSDRIGHAQIEPTSKQIAALNFGTAPGTAAGTVARMGTMFKSFPLAFMQKRLAAEIQGRGYKAGQRMQWLMEGGGPMALIQTAVTMTILGYVGGMMKDIAKGKKPRKWVNDDGSLNGKTLTDSLMRGGAMGVLGDVVLQEYDRSYKNFLSVAAGPVLGQLDPVADTLTKAIKGEKVGKQTADLVKRNTPFVNLFYIRGAVEHLYWQQLAESLSPGTLKRLEKDAAKSGQEYFWAPDELYPTESPWKK